MKKLRACRSKHVEAAELAELGEAPLSGQGRTVIASVFWQAVAIEA